MKVPQTHFLDALSQPSTAVDYRGHRLEIVRPFVLSGAGRRAIVWQPRASIKVNGHDVDLSEDELRQIRRNAFDFDVNPDKDGRPPFSKRIKDLIMAAIDRHIDGQPRPAS